MSTSTEPVTCDNDDEYQSVV